jgi:hypothetical protein
MAAPHVSPACIGPQSPPRLHPQFDAKPPPKQWRPAGALVQSELDLQATHVLLPPSQTGVGALQVELSTHCTHLFGPIWHAGVDARPAQSALVMQPQVWGNGRHACPFGLLVHSELTRQATQELLLRQSGVPPEQPGGHVFTTLQLSVTVPHVLPAHPPPDGRQQVPAPLHSVPPIELHTVPAALSDVTVMIDGLFVHV